MNTELHIILGNHLFPIKHIRELGVKRVFMREDIGLCTYQKHHKHKILLFLSSMRSYRDELIKNNITVHYEKIDRGKTISYINSLCNFIDMNNIKRASVFEIEDKWFEKEIRQIEGKLDSLEIIENPMFLTPRDSFSTLCPISSKPKYKMTNFYINQRKRLGLLIENNKPIGGKWTFDKDNRKKIPKTLNPPQIKKYKLSRHSLDLIPLINDIFEGHIGDLQTFNYPTTRKDALKTVDYFITHKLTQFGDFEDSVDSRSPFWFHSILSPMLNIGLITPDDIISKISTLKDIPINSYEGYIRQIIGWREFMRGIYHHEYNNIHKSNFFKHKRKMTDAWYSGTTGLLPLDYSIKSTTKYAYSHHIERLMIQVNIMNLCEILPKQVYKWFMEMYIDSSDWVMSPNVYSMGLFADGGIMATKPYICGSNYILKMMDFQKGEWCSILDGLYWRFISKNRDFFKSNPRLSMMVSILDKMKNDKKSNLLNIADEFIKKVTIQ